MKLRNKKTGEVVKIYPALNDETAIRFMAEGGKHYEYKSLADFNKEWEDAPEEQKNINGIDVVLDAISEYCNEHSYYSGDLEKIKILNIVEDKLKAFKRLKDKGFRFNGITKTSLDMDCIQFEIGNDFYEEESTIGSELNKDLDLLFGGEE